MTQQNVSKKQQYYTSKIQALKDKIRQAEVDLAKDRLYLTELKAKVEWEMVSTEFGIAKYRALRKEYHQALMEMPAGELKMMMCAKVDAIDELAQKLGWELF